MEQKTKGLKQREERCMYLTYTSCMIEPRQDGYEAGLHTGCLETVRELLAEHQDFPYTSKAPVLRSVL